MRTVLAAALALLLLVPLAPPAPAAEAQDWSLLLGIPTPGEAAAESATATPPLTLGDDVLVAVPRNQNEFSIAANPANPDHLVAGANDYSRGDAWPGFYTSFDGGKTWTHGYIPLPSVYTVGGDAAIVFDKFGAVYYIGIAFNRGATNGGANAIFVSKSLDGGLSWATTDPFKSATSAAFHDKPYIGADPSTGALYLTYTHFGAGGGITFSKSLDGGATWSPKKVLGGGQFSLPLAGADGDIYVTWASGGAKFARSEDGGATWTVTTPLQLSITGAGVPFRVFTYPVMAVAHAGPHAGRVYLAGPGTGSGATGTDMRVQHSDDGGRTWSAAEAIQRPGVPLMPWMDIMPDGTVGIAYMDTWVSSLPGRAGDLLTEGTTLMQTLAVRGTSDPAWTTHYLTDAPSSASATVFWGDYQGLAATSKGFHPAFGDARGQSPCACVGDAKLDFGTMRVAPLALPLP